ncbi:hypothetical protein DVH24_027596 [Malus domestica]|uniref:Uncharacterized protein n=1 Tax=Malus domestica TaxID=3750 RepID=A0A498H8Y6_MALDO|nr:hypothetical protein DVH24_027596 [Malus domestica]
MTFSPSNPTFVFFPARCSPHVDHCFGFSLSFSIFPPPNEKFFKIPGTLTHLCQLVFRTNALAGTPTDVEFPEPQKISPFAQWNEFHHVHTLIIVEGLYFDSFLTFPLTLLHFVFFSHLSLFLISLPSISISPINPYVAKACLPRSPILTSFSHFLAEKYQPNRNFSNSLFKNYKSQRPNSKKKKKKIEFEKPFAFPWIWVFLRFLHCLNLCLAAWIKLGFSLSYNRSVLCRPSLWMRRNFVPRRFLMGFLFKFLFLRFWGFCLYPRILHVGVKFGYIWMFNSVLFSVSGDPGFSFSFFWAFVTQGEQFQLLSLGLLWNQIFNFYDCES